MRFLLITLALTLTLQAEPRFWGGASRPVTLDELATIETIRQDLGRGTIGIYSTLPENTPIAAWNLAIQSWQTSRSMQDALRVMKALEPVRGRIFNDVQVYSCIDILVRETLGWDFEQLSKADMPWAHSWMRRFLRDKAVRELESLTEGERRALIAVSGGVNKRRLLVELYRTNPDDPALQSWKDTLPQPMDVMLASENGLLVEFDKNETAAGQRRSLERAAWEGRMPEVLVSLYSGRKEVTTWANLYEKKKQLVDELREEVTVTTSLAPLVDRARALLDADRALQASAGQWMLVREDGRGIQQWLKGETIGTMGAELSPNNLVVAYLLNLQRANEQQQPKTVLLQTAEAAGVSPDQLSAYLMTNSMKWVVMQLSQNGLVPVADFLADKNGVLGRLQLNDLQVMGNQLMQTRQYDTLLRFAENVSKGDIAVYTDEWAQITRAETLLHLGENQAAFDLLRSLEVNQKPKEFPKAAFYAIMVRAAWTSANFEAARDAFWLSQCLSEDITNDVGAQIMDKLGATYSRTFLERLWANQR